MIASIGVRQSTAFYHCKIALGVVAARGVGYRFQRRSGRHAH